MATNTKEIYVIDASFIMAFLLEEDVSEVKDIFYRFSIDEVLFIAPAIIKYEVGNSLRSQILRKRLTQNEAHKLYQLFLKMNIEECEIDYLETMNNAISKHITFYDASYLTVAIRSSVKLLTLDKALLKLAY